MEAGIDPLRFWEMTPFEIIAAVEGYRKRLKRQVELAHLNGRLFCAGVRTAFDGERYPALEEILPTLF
jgi:hypothetical protein